LTGIKEGKNLNSANGSENKGEGLRVRAARLSELRVIRMSVRDWP
jgi:hypothetical protein